ncbi:hypothetical protein [Mycobacterium sp. 236(2023)]|nr:hypothetical protein [Mycobacterium sp. 236(2023)]MDG4663121.1 hypothetical protein [Mycobacterium sp. 236(2023)]
MGKHSRKDDGHADSHDETPPGPEDHGRDGGMATREIAPELTEPDGD